MTVGFIAEAREKALWGYLHRAGDLAGAVSDLPCIVPHASPDDMQKTIDTINEAMSALALMRRCVYQLQSAHELDQAELPVKGE